MVRIMDGNWGLKVLSVLLAVVLWIYVSSELNPIKEREFKAVTIETRGVKDNLVVGDLPESANIRVRANQNVITELNAKSLEVYVDLAKAETGRQVIPLQVKTPPGVELVEFQPQQVTVTVEHLAEKQIPVRVRFTDTVEEGYRVLAVKVSPNMVILQGPDSVIKNIESAMVEVKLTGRIGSFDEDLPVKLSTEADRLAGERLIHMTPAVVDVFVSVVPEMPSKSVPVQAKIEGEPAEGYQVKTIVVEPETLIITGAQQLISAISQLDTLSLDITGTAQDAISEVGLNLPPEIKSSRQTVRVLVKVGPK